MIIITLRVGSKWYVRTMGVRASQSAAFVRECVRDFGREKGCF